MRVEARRRAAALGVAVPALAVLLAFAPGRPAMGLTPDEALDTCLSHLGTGTTEVAEPVPDESAVLLTDAGAVLPLAGPDRLDPVTVTVLTLFPAALPPDSAEPPLDATLATPDALPDALATHLAVEVPVLTLDELLAAVEAEATAEAIGSEEPGTTTARPATDDPAVVAPSARDVVVIPLAEPSPQSQDDRPDHSATTVGTPDVPEALAALPMLVEAGRDVVLLTEAGDHEAAVRALGTEAATLVVPDLGQAEDVAGLLVGTRVPTGVLTEALVAPPAQDAADHDGETSADDPTDPLLPAGHGLTYWSFDVTGTTAQRSDDGALSVRATLTADGTASGSAPVAVEGRADDGTWALLACARFAVEPGAETAVEVPVDAATAQAVTEVRVRTTDGTPVEAAVLPGGPAATAPDEAPAPDESATPQPPPSDASAPEPGSGSAAVQPRRSERGTDGQVPIHATVPGPTGGLRLTIADGPVAFGAAERLDDRWQLSGALPVVTVTDERPNAVGWSVSVRAGALTASSGATLGPESLGWAPTPPDASRPVAVGPAVATTLSGGPGLVEPATLATARGPARQGPVELGAQLLLETPLDTPPGTYGGTLTVTLFPVD